MFDKATYWKNKGQKILSNVKFYPKGEKVTRIKNNVEIEVVNLAGEHLVRTIKGLKRLNRKEFRTPQRNRLGSASNYKRVKENYGFKHEVSKPHHELQLPVYPSHMTNHLRHKERQVKRALSRT